MASRRGVTVTLFEHEAQGDLASNIMEAGKTSSPGCVILSAYEIARLLLVVA